jgi:hypothetical protein
MPFRIIKDRKGYFVENVETGKRFSKKPMTEINAKKQFRILNKYLSTLEGSGLNKGEVREIATQPLTDLDIKKYIPNARIMSSSEIGNYSDINQLMPKDKESIFIIYESKPNYGHWVLLSKYAPNVFEYFDSYGNDIDAPINWVNSQKQRELDLEPYLTDLLAKDKKQNKDLDIIYNSKDFQKENHNIATCGRHCILRAITIENDNQQLTDYIKMMNSIKDVTGFNYDDIVSAIINI